MSRNDIIVLEFDENGNIICLDDADIEDVLEVLGHKVTKRASHVVPTDPWLRWLFRFIRNRVHRKSPFAQFTRLWPCQWRVDMAPSNGPILGPFISRRRALYEERRWLLKNVFTLTEKS